MKNKKILIIDTADASGKSLAKALEIEEYSVTLVPDGKEALSKLAQDSFDVVLMDLGVPEMEGVSLLRRIKENFDEIDVVIMVDYKMIDTAIEVVKLGASNYITKPIHEEELKLILSETINQKNMKSENEKLKKELVTHSFSAGRYRSLKEALKAPEKKVIQDVLEMTNGNRNECARILDINRTTLYNKMREYDLLGK